VRVAVDDVHVTAPCSALLAGCQWQHMECLCCSANTGRALALVVTVQGVLWFTND